MFKWVRLKSWEKAMFLNQLSQFWGEHPTNREMLESLKIFVNKDFPSWSSSKEGNGHNVISGKWTGWSFLLEIEEYVGFVKKRWKSSYKRKEVKRIEEMFIICLNNIWMLILILILIIKWNVYTRESLQTMPMCCWCVLK